MKYNYCVMKRGCRLEVNVVDVLWAMNQETVDGISEREDKSSERLIFTTTYLENRISACTWQLQRWNFVKLGQPVWTAYRIRQEADLIQPESVDIGLIKYFSLRQLKSVLDFTKILPALWCFLNFTLYQISVTFLVLYIETCRCIQFYN